MKKLLMSVMCAAAIAMTACNPDVCTASGSQKKLKDNGYTVSIYNATEAKDKIKGIVFDGVSLKDALFAEKGKEDDYDFLLAFYFPSIDEAEKFTSLNSNVNLGLMNDYADNNLGKNLEKKVGSHNNVAYVGSVTSFANAF